MRLFFLFAIMTFCSFSISQAQDANPPQQRSQRGGQFAAMEKQLVLDSLQDLSNDQKLIIESIYTDFEAAINEARAGATGDREAMRSTMMGIRDSKNEALQAVLSEEQYKEYEALIVRSRERMQSRRQRNNDQ
jgi:hypothetical protein